MMPIPQPVPRLLDRFAAIQDHRDRLLEAIEAQQKQIDILFARVATIESQQQQLDSFASRLSGRIEDLEPFNPKDV